MSREIIMYDNFLFLKIKFVDKVFK